MGAVSVGDTLIVVGRTAAGSAAVWASPDGGITWYLEELTAPDVDPGPLFDVVELDGRLVAVGHTAPTYGDSGRPLIWLGTFTD